MCGKAKNGDINLFGFEGDPTLNEMKELERLNSDFLTSLQISSPVESFQMAIEIMSQRLKHLRQLQVIIFCTIRKFPFISEL